MHFFTLCCILVSSLVVGQVYFTDKNFLLHSKKDISAFYRNEKHLKRLINSIKGSREFFRNVEKNSTNKPVIKAFCIWLEQRASLCIDS